MKARTYVVDGKQMKFSEIASACPGVKRSTLYRRLNVSRWHRIEDLRIPNQTASDNRKVVGHLTPFAPRVMKIRIGPKMSRKEIAEKYGLSNNVVVEIMRRAGIEETNCGLRSKCYYDKAAVETYMRSIGKLPK